MRYVLVAFVLMLASTLLADGAPPAGSGTPEDPYQIATLDNLLWLSTTDSVWTSHFVQTADIDAAATQTWNDGEGMMTIGSSDTAFGGVYDGQGHAISQLWMDRDSISVALFRLHSAEVMNLRLQDVHIRGYAGGGGICSYAFLSTIRNCEVTGAIETVYYAGGIASQVSSHSSVLQCTSAVSVQAEWSAGGITASHADNCTIQDCRFTGQIDCGSGYGGIAPLCAGWLMNSYYDVDAVLINGAHRYSPGAIESEDYAAWESNGYQFNIDDYLASDAEGYLISSTEDLRKLLIFGQMPGAVFRLTTDLDLADSDPVRIPYFAGAFLGGGHTIRHFTVQDTTAANLGLFASLCRAEVTGLHLADAQVHGRDCVGGIAGACIHSYLRECSFSGSVSGRDLVGGLVGNIGICYECFTQGDVQGNEYVGGIAGRGSGIQNSYSLMSVSGVRYCGGLAGEGEGLDWCYSAGPVQGETWTGGLIGYSQSGSGYSFWNIETSGQAHSDGGTGLTSIQMQSLPIFTNADWDFVDEPDNGTNDIWGMNPDVNNGFPFLMWQGYEHAPIMQATQPTGSGTASDPYLISSLKHLYWLSVRADSLTAHYLQTQDIDASLSQYYFGTAGFPPIGSTVVPFAGTYDGAGYTISNLVINDREDLTGLFAWCEDATIANVHINHADVHGESYLGALAGKAIRSTITGCSVRGEMFGEDYIGGLVGMADSTAFASCDIMAAVEGLSQVGGYVAEALNCTFTDCQGIVQVMATGALFQDSEQAGGLAGTTQGCHILRSHTEGEVTAFDSDAGGLVGMAASTIIDSSYSTCFVNGAQYTGGIVGRISGSSSLHACSPSGIIHGEDYTGGVCGQSQDVPITDCLFRGQVSGLAFTGGIVGHISGTAELQGCSTECSIEGADYTGGVCGQSQAASIADCSFSGELAGGSYTGGIVGALEDTLATRCGANATTQGNLYVGGIAGHVAGGAVTRCASAGEVSGASSVGGLAGSVVQTGSLADCYARAAVGGAMAGGAVGSLAGVCLNTYSTGEITGYLTTGGLVGFNTGSVVSSFWDVTSSGIAHSAGGTGLGTETMTTQSTYLDSDWDFLEETANGTEDIWGMNPQENAGYPFLAWQDLLHDPNNSSEEDTPAPAFYLRNQPNPFNPSTTIHYSIPICDDVELNVYNTRGQLVRCLVHQRQAAGQHMVPWDGTDNTGHAVSSGVYLLRLQAGGSVKTHKILLLK